MTFSVIGTDTETGEPVAIKQTLRGLGTYVIGASGMGKSSILEPLALQDIRQGIGLCYLDPHGASINAILSRIKTKDEKRIILLDIADTDFPFGINLFACNDPQNVLLVQQSVSLVMHIFEKLFEQDRTSAIRIEQLIRMCAFTLIANPGYTLAEMRKLLTHRAFRAKLVANVTDPDIRGFWQTFEQLSPQDRDRRVEGVDARLSEFVGPLVRNIIGQGKTTIDMFDIMQQRKVLLIKLDKRLGDVTSLIGATIISIILNTAYQRGGKNKAKQFNLYVDEFQNFATADMVTLLTEARKFGIGTTIAHQSRYQEGMTEAIRATTLTAGHIIVFRISSEKEQRELTGAFDTSPIPGEPKLQAITEPKYKDWDEQVWESDELKAEHDAIPEKIKAIKHAMYALASAVGIFQEVETIRSGDTKLKLEHLNNYEWNEYEKALSLSPEAYAKGHLDKRKFTWPLKTCYELYAHPAFYLLPPPLDKGFRPWSTSLEVVRYLLEHVFFYPVGQDGQKEKYITSTEDALMKLEQRLPWIEKGQDIKWYQTYDELIFTFPLRNLYGGKFRFPNNILSIAELALWEEKELLHELQEILIPAKEQLVYTYNPEFNIEIITEIVPDHYEQNEHRGMYFNTSPWKSVGKKRVTERKRIDLGLPLEKRMSKWGRGAFDVNTEVLMPVLYWINQRLHDYLEEIQRLGLREIDLYFDHHETVHHKEYLHEEPVYEYIHSPYMRTEERIPLQQWVPTEVPSSEVAHRVANSFGQLDPYVAKAKITKEEEQEDGTIKTWVEEHTITTIKQEKGIAGDWMVDRLDRIQQNMLSSPLPYIRPREEVEQEIRERQDIDDDDFPYPAQRPNPKPPLNPGRKRLN